MAQTSIDKPVKVEVLPEHSGALRRMMSVWFGRWWWLVVLMLIIPSGIALAVDERWWYVTIMIALMVYPTTIWMVYSFYATRPGASLIYCSKTISIDNSSITIDYYNNTTSDEDTPIDSVSDIQPELRCSKVITLDQISGCTANATSLTIEWSEKVWDYVIIPLAAFGDEATAARISEQLLDVAYKNRWQNRV